MPLVQELLHAEMDQNQEKIVKLTDAFPDKVATRRLMLELELLILSL
jgi:hypothetical protein